MSEITAAELKKLRALESRIASTTETLSEVRAKRNEFRSEATEARRELRDSQRAEGKLEKQVSDLVAENAAMADELEVTRREHELIAQKASSVQARNDELTAALSVKTASEKLAQAQLRKTQRVQARLEKQLSILSEKIEGKEAPELTPDQLSGLLGGFIEKVRGQTGLEVTGTQLRLKVGFSGRGGGAFVVPTAGVDPATLPELHEIRIDLTGDNAALLELRADEERG